MGNLGDKAVVKGKCLGLQMAFAFLKMVRKGLCVVAPTYFTGMGMYAVPLFFAHLPAQAAFEMCSTFPGHEVPFSPATAIANPRLSLQEPGFQPLPLDCSLLSDGAAHIFSAAFSTVIKRLSFEDWRMS